MVMEKRTNQPLSPEADATPGPASCDDIHPPSDFDNAPMDLLFNDILSFVPPHRCADSTEPETAGYDRQSK
jgi:hypothetical protein